MGAEGPRIQGLRFPHGVGNCSGRVCADWWSRDEPIRAKLELAGTTLQRVWPPFFACPALDQWYTLGAAVFVFIFRFMDPGSEAFSGFCIHPRGVLQCSIYSLF